MNPKTKRRLRAVLLSLAAASLLVYAYIWIALDVARSETIPRVKADFRSLAAALEAYHEYYGIYPDTRPMKAYPPKGGSVGGQISTLKWLSDPTQSGQPGDPSQREWIDPFTYRRGAIGYGYWKSEKMGDQADDWLIWSAGPDGDHDFTDPDAVYEPGKSWRMLVGAGRLNKFLYDPSNGLNTSGDIMRWK